MTGQEIHGGGRLASRGGVEIRGTEDPLNHGPHDTGIASEELPGRVAEMAVPLHPAAVGGEVPNLVETAGIPRLGDQVATGEDRIVGQGLEQGGVGKRIPIAVATQD